MDETSPIAWAPVEEVDGIGREIPWKRRPMLRCWTIPIVEDPAKDGDR